MLVFPAVFCSKRINERAFFFLNKSKYFPHSDCKALVCTVPVLHCIDLVLPVSRGALWMNEEYVGGSRRSTSVSCLLWLKAVHLVGLWIDFSITVWNLAHAVGHNNWAFKRKKATLFQSVSAKSCSVPRGSSAAPCSWITTLRLKGYRAGLRQLGRRHRHHISRISF